MKNSDPGVYMNNMGGGVEGLRMHMNSLFTPVVHTNRLLDPAIDTNSLYPSTMQWTSHLNKEDAKSSGPFCRGPIILQSIICRSYALQMKRFAKL
jgi:hypothetical protein